MPNASAPRRTLIGLLGLLLALGVGDLAADTIGMVIDRASSTAIVFDADTDTVLGTIKLPAPINSAHDCVLLEDQTRGFVNDFFGHAIWILDLEVLDLDGGANPVRVSIAPEDLTITRDRQWVIASGGAASDLVSVISTVDRVEVETLNDVAIHSVEACSDDSVLATSTIDHELKRLQIDSAGGLTEYESLSYTNAFNAACAPMGGTGVLVDAMTGNVLASVLYPPLIQSQARTTPASPVSVVVSPTGEEVFVRSTSRNSSFVEGYAFDSVTGAFGSTPFVTIPTTRAYLYFGVDQLAVHPGGRKVYIPEGDSVGVYDSTSGTLLTRIEDTALGDAAGVCVTPNPGVAWDIKLCDPTNMFNCKRTKGTVPVTLLGGFDLDVTQIDATSLRLALDTDLSVMTGEPKRVNSPLDVASREDIGTSMCAPDGLADLKVVFRASEVATMIGCGSLTKGDPSPPLVIRGTLLNGTPFVATNTQLVFNTAH